jgi:hypothetical protein
MLSRINALVEQDGAGTMHDGSNYADLPKKKCLYIGAQIFRRNIFGKISY